MENVHDNEIISYEVNLQEKEIVLHTHKRNISITKKIDLVFTSVFAHYFEHEISGSIILDIEEGELLGFMTDNKELLTKGYAYGWPVGYHTKGELVEKLEKEGYHYYIINSSYGLNGWILAKDFNVL